MPIHIGQTIINGVMDLKEEVGKLSGKIDGMQSTVGDLHGRVSQCMTRDECASLHSGQRRAPTPSTEARKAVEWWAKKRNQIAVISGSLVLLVMLGTAFYWMSSAYTVIQKARVEIKEGRDSGVNP